MTIDTDLATLREQLRHLGPWRGAVGDEALDRVEAVIEAAQDVALNEYDEIGPYVYVHIQEIRALRKALAALEEA